MWREKARSFLRGAESGRVPYARPWLISKYPPSALQAALPATIRCVVEVWTSNVRILGSVSSKCFRLGIFRALLQSLDGFGGRQDQQFNFAPLGLLFDFFHHWKSAVRAGSDHEALTFPRYLLLNRSSTDNGVWPNCSRNCLEGFFLRLRSPHRSQRRA